MLQYLYSSSILSASFLPVFRRLWFYTEFFDFFNLDSLRNTLQQVTTLDDVLYLGMKNDISFLIDSYMNLYEAQSTLNPNMPLRGLFYFSRLYSSYAGHLLFGRVAEILDERPQSVKVKRGFFKTESKIYLILTCEDLALAEETMVYTNFLIKTKK